MLTFALVAFLNGQSYILDSGLTEDDCAAEISMNITEFQIDEIGTMASADGAVFSCEVE